MVLRRGRRAVEQASSAQRAASSATIEVELEPNDPLSGAAVEGGPPDTTSFRPPDAAGEEPDGATPGPRRRIAVPPGDHSPRTRASRMLPLRIVIVSIMGVALALLAGRAFDETVTELLVPPLAVGVVALVARRWRLAFRIVVAAVAVGGSTAAVGTLAGIDAADMLGELADGPRRLVTTEWPSPLDGGVVMVVALGLALVIAIAAELAGRPRFHVAPLGSIMVGFTAVMAISAPVHPSRWPLAVLGAGTVLLLFSRPGTDPRSRLRLLLGERSLMITLGGLLIAGIVAASTIAWTDRADPRQEVDADVTLSLLDPVEEMVALRRADPEFDMFDITDRSALIGPSLPTRWRLSALDQYDGQRWLPAATLRPIGSRLGLPTPANPDLAPPITYDVTIRTDDTSLVPLPGRPLEFDGGDDEVIETDEQRTVVRLVETPEPGMTAQVSAEVAPTDAAAVGAGIAVRQVDEIASTFGDQAEALGELAGEGATIIERLRAIERDMRENWFLDEGSEGGQQLALIQIFVNESQRGTSEQFATAFALFARSLGVDARVATGFLVPRDRLRSALELRSTDAAVWPEVRVNGMGWLAFDPAPPQEADTDDDETPPPSKQSSAAVQPPDDEQPEPDDEPTDEVDDAEADTAGIGSVSVWLTRGAVIGGTVVLLVVGAISTVLLLKWRRRRRRLRATDPARRIAGAWANTTDSLVDAGLDIGPAWTDDRIAERAGAVAPTVPHDLRRLAASATAMTFGHTERSSALVDDARRHVTPGRPRHPRRPLALAAPALAVEHPLAAFEHSLAREPLTAIGQSPTSAWRSSRLRNLPLALRGSCSSRNQIVAGTLNLAIRSARNAWSASAVSEAPGRSTTAAATSSPRRSSGTPNTAASATSGC